MNVIEINNYITKKYMVSYKDDVFIIEFVDDNNFNKFECWLYIDIYGIKMFILGLEKDQQGNVLDFDDFISMMLNNITSDNRYFDEYIADLKNWENVLVKC